MLLVAMVFLSAGVLPAASADHTLTIEYSCDWDAQTMSYWCTGRYVENNTRLCIIGWSDDDSDDNYHDANAFVTSRLCNRITV